MVTMNDIWRAYEAATGQWRGCTWPTHYGSLGLDLDRVSSSQARCKADRWRGIAGEEVADNEITAGEEASLVDMGLHLRLRSAVICQVEDQESHLEVCGNPARRFCAELLAREWEFAANWLEEIESDARWASQEAQEAVSAAECEDWQHALEHAGQACQIESEYNDCRPWRQLKQVIEKAALR
jgi:hypothetical protein